MTFAAVPALRAQPELLATWEARATSARYDERDIPAGRRRARSAAWA